VKEPESIICWCKLPMKEGWVNHFHPIAYCLEIGCKNGVTGREQGPLGSVNEL
jgi:hypothetical protein